MTTTSVSDAIVLPQSQGTGLSGENAVVDAAVMGLMARYTGGEYVDTTYASGLQFQNHDGTNDTVEVAPGAAFVKDTGTSTSGNRSSGGNPQSESTSSSGYDTELPSGHTYIVLFPTATQISVSDSTLNAVHIDIDVSNNNGVSLEHDGSTTASPGNVSLKIGETNPDDATADTRANDDGSVTLSQLNSADITNAATDEVMKSQGDGTLSFGTAGGGGANYVQTTRPSSHSSGEIWVRDDSFGTEIWNTSLTSANQFGDFIDYDNDSVYIARDNGDILSLDKFDGTQNWKTDGNSTAGKRSITYYDNSVYAGDNNGDLIELDTAGNVQNTLNLYSDRISSIVIKGDNVYTVSGGNNTAYSHLLSDGTENWNYPQQTAGSLNTLNVKYGFVFILGSSLEALNKSDGTQNWNSTSEGTSAHIDDQSMYMASGGNSPSLIEINSEKDRKHWSTSLDLIGYGYSFAYGCNTMFVSGADNLTDGNYYIEAYSDWGGRKLDDVSITDTARYLIFSEGVLYTVTDDSVARAFVGKPSVYVSDGSNWNFVSCLDELGNYGGRD